MAVQWQMRHRRAGAPSMALIMAGALAAGVSAAASPTPTPTKAVTATAAPAKPALWRSAARLNYARVSEVEARMYTKGLATYEKLGLDGESDVRVISTLTGALTVLGGAGGILAAQALPGPDIVRWTASAACVMAPYGVLATGLAAPETLQRGVAAARRGASPAYRARMLRHEAGHFLAGHLVGLRVSGYTADAAACAVQCEASRAEAARGDASVLDKMAVVSLAGVMAECLCFGTAEGGLADLSQLQAAQSLWRARESAAARRAGEAGADADSADADERNRVRWAAVQAYALLYSNGPAFERLAAAMEAGLPVDACVDAIESPGSGGADGAAAAAASGAAAAGGAAAAEAAAPAWAFAGGKWPIEREGGLEGVRRAEAKRRAADDDDDDASALDAAGRQLGDALGAARAVVTRDPTLAAAIVSASAAVALVLQEMARGGVLS